MALNPDASVPGLVLAHAAAHGADVVLRKKDRGIWRAVTWSEFATRVRQVAAALQATGFSPGDVACVLADTRPDWVVIDLGIMLAGGVSGGIHPAEDSARLGGMLRNSNARVLFVENEEQLDKALTARDACPSLQRIVVLDMKGLRDFADAGSESFHDFLGHGTSVDASNNAGQAVVLMFDADGCAQIFSQADMLRLIEDAARTLGPRAADERLAILPMSDMTERVFGLYLALYSRTVSNYLENPDTVVENLREVKPTVLGADPAFWQQMFARTQESAAAATHTQRVLYNWAIASGGTLARLLVLRAVRRDLGLSRLRLAFVDASMIAPDVQRWASALGITIRHVDARTASATPTGAAYGAVAEEAYTT